jgi:exodeoxyribonuclease VII small subunit
MTRKQAAKDQEPLDFEGALNELEALVEKLESGDLGLSESLEHFEKGIGLSRRCHSLLDDARQKVTLLSNPDDEASATDFNPPDETSD